MASAAPRRVAVVGLGCVTSLGLTAPSTWKRVLAGDCGITKLDPARCEGVNVTIGAPLPPVDWPAALGRAQAGLSPFIRYALHAAKEAIADARMVTLRTDEQRRSGAAIGSAIANLDLIVEQARVFERRGMRRVSPHFVPSVLGNMAAGHVSIEYDLRGPIHSASTACTSGAHAIGDAFRFIRNGDADLMVAGGTDALLSPLSIAGFSQARALATNCNDQPEQASRPFDAARSGFVMGEGAGVVVLEDYERALQRGRTIYAEMVGYGLSGDANHMTAPPEDGEGAARCMQAAMREAGVGPDDVNYINAHATSTPLGDLAEARAITKVFGVQGRNRDLAVSSTKGATGHLLGAAGAIEAIFTILALHEGKLPPNINMQEVSAQEPEIGALNLVRTGEQPLSADRLQYALTNSFGFGGTNASLCFKRVTQQVVREYSVFS